MLLTTEAFSQSWVSEALLGMEVVSQHKLAARLIPKQEAGRRWEAGRVVTNAL